MTFEQWYVREIGITPGEANLRGVWDVAITEKCWQAAQAVERGRWAPVVAHAVAQLSELDDETAQAQAVSLRCILEATWPTTDRGNI